MLSPAAACWDRQYRFRIRLGPLSLGDYERFLPGSSALLALRDWVRQLRRALEWQWDVQLVLQQGPRCPRCGWASATAATAPGSA